jgi:hypothetical protein
MTTATVRTTARQPHAKPLGTGPLHRALEEADEISRLNSFCSAHVCTSDQVSKDGKRLDMLMVFALMRTRGYTVSEPTRPQQQPRKTHTMWLVEVTLPSGPAVRLSFCTPNPP